MRCCIITFVPGSYGNLTSSWCMKREKVSMWVSRIFMGPLVARLKIIWRKKANLMALADFPISAVGELRFALERSCGSISL